MVADKPTARPRFPPGQAALPRKGAVTPSPASPDLLGKTGFPSLLQIHPGTGCSEGFYHLRFLTILPGVAEVKPGSEPRENKGNIYLLCSEAAVPHTHQHPVLTCRSQLLPQPLPPCPQS